MSSLLETSAVMPAIPAFPTSRVKAALASGDEMVLAELAVLADDTADASERRAARLCAMTTQGALDAIRADLGLPTGDLTAETIRDRYPVAA